MLQAFGGVAPTVKALVVDGSTLCDEDEVQDVLSDGATVEAVLTDDEALAALHRLVWSEPQRRFIEQSLEQKGSSPSVL